MGTFAIWYQKQNPPYFVLLLRKPMKAYNPRKTLICHVAKYLASPNKGGQICISTWRISRPSLALHIKIIMRLGLFTATVPPFSEWESERERDSHILWSSASLRQSRRYPSSSSRCRVALLESPGHYRDVIAGCAFAVSPRLLKPSLLLCAMTRFFPKCPPSTTLLPPTRVPPPPRSWRSVKSFSVPPCSISTPTQWVLFSFRSSFDLHLCYFYFLTFLSIPMDFVEIVSVSFCFRFGGFCVKIRFSRFGFYNRVIPNGFIKVPDYCRYSNGFNGF